MVTSSRISKLKRVSWDELSKGKAQRVANYGFQPCLSKQLYSKAKEYEFMDYRGSKYKVEIVK